MNAGRREMYLILRYQAVGLSNLLNTQFYAFSTRLTYSQVDESAANVPTSDPFAANPTIKAITH